MKNHSALFGNLYAKTSAPNPVSQKKRPAYDLIIGLDIGSTYTKCVVTDNFITNGDRFVVPLNPSDSLQEGECLLASEITYIDDMAKIPGDDGFAADIAYRYFKPKLAEACRASSSEALTHAKHFCDFSTAVASRIGRWIRTSPHWSDFGSNADDAIRIHLSMPLHRDDLPDADYSPSDRAILKHYRCIIQQSYINGLAPTLEIDTKSTSYKTGLLNCTCRSECIANLETFMQSPRHATGFYIFADVGGGTVDVNIISWEKSKQRLTFYASDVIWLGSALIERITAKISANYPYAATPTILEIRSRKENASRRLPPLIESIYQSTLSVLVENIQKRFAYPIAQFCKIGGFHENGRWNHSIKRLRQRDLLVSGGGYLDNPYGEGFKQYFLKVCNWTYEECPICAMLPIPSKLILPKCTPSANLSRFSVAYGLSSEQFSENIRSQLSSNSATKHSDDCESRIDEMEKSISQRISKPAPACASSRLTTKSAKAQHHSDVAKQIAIYNATQVSKILCSPTWKTLLRHKHSPQPVLNQIDIQVRRGLLINPHTPKSFLKILQQDHQLAARNIIVSATKSPNDMTNMARKSCSHTCSNRTTTESKPTLASESDKDCSLSEPWRTLATLPQHTKAGISEITRVLGELSLDCRKNAIANPSTPRKILAILARDPLREIADAARVRLSPKS